MIHEHHFNLPTPRQPTQQTIGEDANSEDRSTNRAPASSQTLHHRSSKSLEVQDTQPQPKQKTTPDPSTPAAPNTIISRSGKKTSSSKTLRTEPYATPREERGKGSAGTMDPRILGYPALFLPIEAEEGPRKRRMIGRDLPP
ncbi:hypothetical protein ACOSP7_031140 [Xanthoceras sorbifolium]